MEYIILLLSIIILLFSLVIPSIENKLLVKKARKDSAKAEIPPKTVIQPNGTQKNKRKNFRVKANDIYCIVKFDHFGDPKLQKLKDKTIEGYIEDISLTGMKFVSNYELPVRSDIRITTSFQLDQFVFSLKGKIVRRQDHLKFENVIYGIEFTDLLPNQQKQLNGWLNNHLKGNYVDRL
ncbi:PilZ domain-containing protein [Bacillus sp. EB600]|uniref:PilZ domain-containing protein n=1 Tax=Bacillus sp. EB600 TaxID=2806345 RepID=UPI00210DE8F4|nr:PilZ domain-containing protein [Bacillus sp. EB600]MCQ6278573.1 PilZ domain-containing protein [Bacillus sp. EB600]